MLPQFTTRRYQHLAKLRYPSFHPRQAILSGRLGAAGLRYRSASATARRTRKPLPLAYSYIIYVRAYIDNVR